jgi:hypothetical protein
MGREKLKLGQIIFNNSSILKIKCENKVCLSQLKEDYTDLFYPQDWYEKESFMNEYFIPGEYIISKNIIKSSRGKDPKTTTKTLYPASLIAYTFISLYKTHNEILWPNDYIWCTDLDSSGDQIYVGRYYDPLGLSKDGFSIHRHLTIKENYGWF